MAKKTIEVTLDPIQVVLVKTALNERKGKLEKMVTTLLKERQTDSVKPIMAQIEGLSEVEAQLADVGIED